MRIAVLGGTEFIGPAIVEEALRAGHQVTVVHRGFHEPAGLAEVPHVHCDRRDHAGLRKALAGAEAVIDTCAYARRDAESLTAARPAGARILVLSSMDVYRAYGAILRGEESDAMPLTEDSPLRTERYLQKGKPPPPLRGADPATYEKLDVEEVARKMGALVLRLPIVFGPRDPLRREEPLLRRARAGRERIPFGAGNLLWTQASARDVASAVLLGIEQGGGLEGAVLNVGYRRAWTIEQWARRVLAAAGSKAELVRVPDAALPPDLAITGTFKQHMLVDCSRARLLLGWQEIDPEETLTESVRWHLDHPPPDPDGDFSADDRALAAGSV